MLRVKAKERKQRAMEAKVEDSEKKLAEFNARLTVRKNKVRSVFFGKNDFFALISLKYASQLSSF